MSTSTPLWSFCRNWWERFPVTTTRLSPLKPRWRGFWNSVIEGSLSEGLVGSGARRAVGETACEDDRGGDLQGIPSAGSGQALRLRDCSALRTNPSAQDDRARGVARIAQNFSDERPQSGLFHAISRELLLEGNGIRFQARGASMSPAIRDGEIVHVKSVPLAELRSGDIVLIKGEMGFRLHRLVVADAAQDVFITRGDCGQQDDPAVSGEEILGIAVAKEVRVGARMVPAKLKGIGGRVIRGAARGQWMAKKLLDRVTTLTSGTRKDARVLPCLLALLFGLLAMNYAGAQVAVDAE